MLMASREEAAEAVSAKAVAASLFGSLICLKQNISILTGPFAVVNTKILMNAAVAGGLQSNTGGFRPLGKNPKRTATIAVSKEKQ